MMIPNKNSTLEEFNLKTGLKFGTFTSLGTPSPLALYFYGKPTNSFGCGA
jgi:hypothetical protein